jgi:hypothetical protein
MDLADLLKIDHSLTDGHIVRLSGTAPQGAVSLPHELVAAPSIVFQLPSCSPKMLSPSADDKNLTFSAAEAGAYDFLLVNNHSLWGEGQWNTLVTSVSPEGVTAIPHGLIRSPDVIALGGRSGTNVALSDVEADAKNVYVANHGKSTESVELLLVAVHSIIAPPPPETK